ncbi:MAG TPA: HemK family protein methyltransferase, partial [Candidatus Dojkabacteria bacterium]|nr:HemK family protein methyltransferase [Candidatus Dojkabacteria bacterium]
HIKGNSEFKGYIFKVNEHTLIPRIETEQLVDMVINNIDQKTDFVLDICSGTGCILISIILELQKKENFLNENWKDIKFIAVEKDSKAIEVLRENLALHNLQDRIEIIQSDLLDSYPYDLKNTIIVTNPPYISLKDYKKLDKSVLDYEPEIALLGGEMGYEITQKLLEDIAKRKKSNLSIFLETSPDISDYLYLLSKNIFPTNKVKIIEDIYNLPRFISIN